MTRRPPDAIRGLERESAVSFSFDDGPDAVWTPRVCAELARLDVHATFFVIGTEVSPHPDLVAAVLEMGHEVQLHCHRHVRHTLLTEQELVLDTEQALEALAGVGVHPTLWRAPWGVQTAASGRVARSFGLELVGWSIDTHDWRGDPAASMLATARSKLPAGGAVLMHDGLGPGATRAGCENTVSLLDGLADAARQLGLAIGPMRGTGERGPMRRISERELVG